MITHTTMITVQKKPASQIYDWLLNLNRERYLKWHSDHRDYRVIHQTEHGVGSIFYFEEILDNVRLNFQWELVEFKKDEFILTRAKFPYPISLLLSMTEKDGNTEVKHELKLGFIHKRIARVADWLVSQLIFTNKKAKALSRHALEEFKNLEHLELTIST